MGMTSERSTSNEARGGEGFIIEYILSGEPFVLNAVLRNLSDRV
jgi:hypothetical protein